MSRWKKRYGPLGKEWAKLGLRIISDRRLCLGGRILEGVVFPKNEALQGIVMKKLLVWYLDCFDLRAPKTSAGFYKLNNACFRQRQSELQRIFRRLSGGCRHSGINILTLSTTSLPCSISCLPKMSCKLDPV